MPFFLQDMYYGIAFGGTGIGGTSISGACNNNVFLPPGSDPITDFCFTDDGSKMYISTYDNAFHPKIHVFDIDTFTLAFTYGGLIHSFSHEAPLSVRSGPGNMVVAYSQQSNHPWSRGTEPCTGLGPGPYPTALTVLNNTYLMDPTGAILSSGFARPQGVANWTVGSSLIKVCAGPIYTNAVGCFGNEAFEAAGPPGFDVAPYRAGNESRFCPGSETIFGSGDGAVAIVTTPLTVEVWQEDASVSGSNHSLGFDDTTFDYSVACASHPTWRNRPVAGIIRPWQSHVYVFYAELNVTVEKYYLVDISSGGSLNGLGTFTSPLLPNNSFITRKSFSEPSWVNPTILFFGIGTGAGRSIWQLTASPSPGDLTGAPTINGFGVVGHMFKGWACPGDGGSGVPPPPPTGRRRPQGVVIS